MPFLTPTALKLLGDGAAHEIEIGFHPQEVGLRQALSPPSCSMQWSRFAGLWHPLKMYAIADRLEKEFEQVLGNPELLL
jgi:hypothetical protein